MIHLFLRSIGFSELKQNADLYRFLEDVIRHPDERGMTSDTNGNEFACFSRYVTEDAGISVCGNFVRENEFRMEHYFPFLRGSSVTTCEPTEYERHSGQESFMGICDDMKLGLPLVFHIVNVIDVLRETKYTAGLLDATNVVMSGLALSGKIVLPTTQSRQVAAVKNKTVERRKELLQRAREGNQDAMDNLTLKDMDTYAAVSRRSLKEDVLTIVETSLIPYGTESDQYTIIGEIRNCFQTQNQFTGEKIWIMTLLSNELQFDVCVNAKDLLGEPEVGRRFKGQIWLQGYLNFGY